MRLILPHPPSQKDTEISQKQQQQEGGMVVLNDDEELLEQYNVQNEMELYVVFQISEDEWEAVAVDTPPELANWLVEKHPKQHVFQRSHNDYVSCKHPISLTKFW